MEGRTEATERLSNWQLIKAVVSHAGASAQEFGRLKWLATVVGSATAAYVLGGAVLALRLERAGFPVQDGLNVIPFPEMLVTGVRELVITAIVGLVLFSVVLGLGTLLRRLIPGVSEELVIAIAAVVLLLFVPLTMAGLAWPAALSLLGVALYVAKRHRARDPSWLPSLAVVIGVGLIAMVAVTLLRYTSPPYRFPVASVLLKPVEGVSKQAAHDEGGYLGETSDYVYLAWPDDPETTEEDPRIFGYAREDVIKVALFPPPPPVSAPTSLVEEIFGLDVSVTPIGDVWDNGNYTGWRLLR